jgi:hypothetical protein
VGQIVAWQLQRAVPTRRFELDILAFLGDSLEQQHKKLSAITKRPDAVIIYSGHNEFTARFKENRDYSLVEEPRLRLLQPAHRVSLHSPFCRLVYELVSKNRLDSPPLMNGRHQLIDPPLCSPSETAEVLADFTARLEATVGYCERIGALPILIVPPANEADYEPSRSTLPPTVSGTERDRLVREFFEARGVEATNPALGQSLFRGILDRHPGFAEAHFRLGRLLQHASLIDEARRHFSEALENDGLLNRCKLAFSKLSGASSQARRTLPATGFAPCRPHLAERGVPGAACLDSLVSRQEPDRPAQAGGQPSDSRLLGRNDNLLDLPVLEIHGRSPAQEADDSHELIVFPAPDHGSLDPG